MATVSASVWSRFPTNDRLTRNHEIQFRRFDDSFSEIFEKWRTRMICPVISRMLSHSISLERRLQEGGHVGAVQDLTTRLATRAKKRRNVVSSEWSLPFGHPFRVCLNIGSNHMPLEEAASRPPESPFEKVDFGRFLDGKREQLKYGGSACQ